MKTMKRILALCLALACLLTLVPAAAMAEQTRSGSTNNKLIALTFDDGPGKDTKRLLDALKARGVHCTFFIVGAMAEGRKDVVRQCYEDGHQIASHTYDHPMLTKKTDDQIRWQLSKTAGILDGAIGGSYTYMLRPPYGDYNQRVLNAAGVPAFYWSDDSGDWRTQDSNTVYNNVIRGAEDGDILLLHDSHSWSVDAAIRVVDTLLARGFEFVTLSELFRRRGVPLQAGKIYSWLRQNGTNLPGISKPTIKTTALENGVEVSITADAGTKIYYTTDGTIPRSYSKVYTEPFLVTGTTTITAVAGYDMNGSRSNPAKTTITVRACAAPQIKVTPEGEVTITSADQAYYTLDGTEPKSATATAYSAPFTVEPGTLVKAMAYSGKVGECASSSVFVYYTPLKNVFDDVLPGKWYTSAVDEVAASGLMVGTAGYHFSPMMELSRAQLVTILHRVSGTPKAAAAATFEDVPAGKWYSDAIAWCQENGIVAGYEDGLFHPSDAITKEQTAAILMRYTAHNDFETEGRNDLAAFADADRIHAYAKEAVAWAVDCGFISGDGKGNLDPRGTLVRASTASMLTRYLAAAETWEKIHLSDEALGEFADTVLKLLAAKDFAALKAYIHPEKGVTFSPYPNVEATDPTFAADTLEAAYASEDVLVWGAWDGSGEEIRMTFAAYYDRFVWDADFTEADQVSVNQIGLSGNAVENVREAYEDCLFVQYDVNDRPEPETEPTEPATDPTEPTEPSETGEPAEPTDPTPTDAPTEPGEPVETSEPTDEPVPSEDPQGLRDPASPEEDTDPGEDQPDGDPEPAPEDPQPNWASLKLVFQRFEGKWYLVGIIHGEWTT